MPPKKTTGVVETTVTEETPGATQVCEPIPPFNGITEAEFSLSITRKYGAVEITLNKTIHAAVSSLEDQHRVYDKLTQQLEWHHGRIANERLAKGRPNGNPK